MKLSFEDFKKDYGGDLRPIWFDFKYFGLEFVPPKNPLKFTSKFDSNLFFIRIFES